MLKHGILTVSLASAAIMPQLYPVFLVVLLVWTALFGRKEGTQIGRDLETKTIVLFFGWLLAVVLVTALSYIAVLLSGISGTTAFWLFMTPVILFSAAYCSGMVAGMRAIPRGKLRIRVGADIITTDVKVIAELPDAFVLAYTPAFVARHPNLHKVVVKKSDPSRTLEYTRFTAVSDPYNGWFEMKSSPYGKVGASVFIAEETPAYVRLRYSRWFAVKYPALCREWIAKDDPNVSVIDSFR